MAAIILPTTKSRPFEAKNNNNNDDGECNFLIVNKKDEQLLLSVYKYNARRTRGRWKGKMSWWDWKREEEEEKVN